MSEIIYTKLRWETTTQTLSLQLHIYICTFLHIYVFFTCSRVRGRVHPAASLSQDSSVIIINVLSFAFDLRTLLSEYTVFLIINSGFDQKYPPGHSVSKIPGNAPDTEKSQYNVAIELPKYNRRGHHRTEHIQQTGCFSASEVATESG